MTSLLPIALRYLKAGISVVPVASDGTKRPAFAYTNRGFLTKSQAPSISAYKFDFFFNIRKDPRAALTAEGVTEPKKEIR